MSSGAGGADARPLAGKVCLVAGASRGVGRGIARGLGEAGATVIATARSSETGPRTDGRSEAVEDTAREVDLAGGRGAHYLCDHASEREVDGLVSWVRRRYARIDVAVSSVWGGNEGFDGERHADGTRWGTPFWRRPAAPLSRGFETGPRAAFLLARAVAPTMISMGGGLVVFVTFDDGGAYLGDVVHDTAMAATNRLAFACDSELAPHGVAVLALSPGFVRTERVRDAGQGGAATESPLYAGRAVAALAALPPAARSELGGRTLLVADLAATHGFADEDGTRPGRFRVG